MAISGAISPLIWVIIIVTLLITPLITTHEPPSGVQLQLVFGQGFAEERLGALHQHLVAIHAVTQHAPHLFPTGLDVLWRVCVRPNFMCCIQCSYQ